MFDNKLQMKTAICYIQNVFIRREWQKVGNWDQIALGKKAWVAIKLMNVWLK